MNGLREFLEKVDSDCLNTGTCELEIKEAEAYVSSGYLERVAVGGSGGLSLFSLTEDGNKALDELRNNNKPHCFDLMDGCELLPKKRLHRSEKPSYPYELMKIWQAFFVGCENEMEEAAVRSSVSHANKKYEGQSFASVKALRYEKFGNFIAPCNGILVMRVDKTN